MPQKPIKKRLVICRPFRHKTILEKTFSCFDPWAWWPICRLRRYLKFVFSVSSAPANNLGGSRTMGLPLGHGSIGDFRKKDYIPSLGGWIFGGTCLLCWILGLWVVLIDVLASFEHIGVKDSAWLLGNNNMI